MSESFENRSQFQPTRREFFAGAVVALTAAACGGSAEKKTVLPSKTTSPATLPTSSPTSELPKIISLPDTREQVEQIVEDKGFYTLPADLYVTAVNRRLGGEEEKKETTLREPLEVTISSVDSRGPRDPAALAFEPSTAEIRSLDEKVKKASSLREKAIADMQASQARQANTKQIAAQYGIFTSGMEGIDTFFLIASLKQ